MKVSFDRFVLVFTLIFTFNTGYAAEKIEKAEVVTTNQSLSLTEKYTLTNTLPKQLIDLRKQVDELADPNIVSAQIKKLSSKVKELEWETTIATTDPNLNSHDLLFLDTKLTKIETRIDKLNRRIESNIHDLEFLSNKWLANELQLQKFTVQNAAETDLTDALPTVETLNQIITNAQQLIDKKIRPTLLAGKKIGEIQARVYTLNDKVSDLLQDLSDFGFQQTAPPMFSIGFYSRFDHEILKQSRDDILSFGTYQTEYFKKNIIGIFSFLAVILLVAFLTRKSKPLVKASYR